MSICYKCNGLTQTYKYKYESCSSCYGRGYKSSGNQGNLTCGVCNGSGKVRRMGYITCNVCHGNSSQGSSDLTNLPGYSSPEPDIFNRTLLKGCLIAILIPVTILILHYLSNL